VLDSSRGIGHSALLEVLRVSIRRRLMCSLTAACGWLSSEPTRLDDALNSEHPGLWKGVARWWRRGLVGVAVIAACTILASCSPANRTGITVTEAGVPVLRNCGAFFRDVQVSDAETGRTVWSAGKPTGTNEFGVSEVELGVQPDKDWVERVPATIEPRPVMWRFAIQFRDWDPETILVADADLANGQIYRPGKSGHISEKSFTHDVCGYGTLLSWGFVWKGGLAVVLLFVVVYTYEARATKRRA